MERGAGPSLVDLMPPPDATWLGELVDPELVEWVDWSDPRWADEQWTPESSIPEGSFPEEPGRVGWAPGDELLLQLAGPGRVSGEALAGVAPSPGLVAALCTLDDPRDPAAEVWWIDPGGPRCESRALDEAELSVGVAQAWDRVAAWACAQRETAVQRARALMVSMPAPDPVGVPRWSGAEAAAGELAAALRISPRSIDARLERGARLHAAHPGTRWLLERGLLTWAHAQAVVEVCAPLTDPAHLAAVEARVLAAAPEQTPAQLRRSLVRAVARVDPAGHAARHTAAAESVGVRMVPLPDALVMITAVLPAPAGQTVLGALDTLATALRATTSTTENDATTSRDGDTAGGVGAGAGRSGSRRRVGAAERADALVALAAALAAHPELIPGVLAAEPARPLVRVTISADTLLGLTQHPGELAGYGPIPAGMARALAADGTWARFVTDPATGQLLDATPHRYTPSGRTRAFVVARDQTCRHPGCSAPAETADLDHTRPFNHQDPARGGPTTTINLGPRCRRHHNLKTWHGWRTWTTPDGAIAHRTPLGRTYTIPVPPQPTV
ncbi:HNH endonuclease signature motif containing protein [Motilibacter peucedani]|uniref:HNH endonuclease signature motif containing protein n=1 Tax=Motilibacter peucedani TaxID=598650 RepID=UPI0016040D3C|nr:HNH endonuclease signature motif containing protein [Motilibacter peucedani]